ncbi:MAG: thioester reductase domain-containing protein [Anaerolineae bacterium]|nr:thioester reductase domain-containing protein [Anaerolineae bacterium]
MTDLSDRIEHLSPLKRALLTLEEMEAKLNAAERAATEPIAIVGLACRFPGGANNPDAFWQLLQNGFDAISEVPPARWIVDAVAPHLTNADKAYLRWGGFLEQVDQFDADFFGILPREAAAMDPQQRLLLEVVWEALAIGAGLSPERLRGSRTGVFVGISSADYSWLHFANPARIDAYTGIGTAHSMAANRLSYQFDFEGPSLVVDTACSSSLVAVHLACSSLRQQECHLALAGGVNLILSPLLNIAFSKTGLLAPDGRCKTFDARANGYVRGEGCGMVVLKRLADALAEGDDIQALIQGTAVNQDGRSAGLTAPNGQAQQAVIRQALARAGVDPAQITYIEAHGTGTALGDPIEVEALASVFNPSPLDRSPCAIGSVKTNLGHLEAAAGIAGLIKVVLALRHQAIPPHLHFQKLNPEISLRNTPFVIPAELRPWPAGDEKRYAGVSSFGFGGTNAHVILAESPPEYQPDGGRWLAGDAAHRWQRQRYWLEATPGTVAGYQAERAPAHPLLARHLQSARPGGDSLWETDLDLQHLTYLADHRIQDVGVVPATLYLEMILAAAHEAFESGAHILTGVEFQKPIFLPEQGAQTVQVVMSVAGNDRADFHIFSRPKQPAPSSDWTLHVTGQLQLEATGAPAELPPPISPAEVQARCPQEISGDDYYLRLQEFGLERGPLFQGIQRVWRGKGEALGQIRVVNGLAPEVKRYLFHPAVFDACLQVLAAALSGEEMAVTGQGIYLPTGLNEFRFYGRPGVRVWSYARLRQQGAGTVEVDICLFDEAGRVAAELLGLRVQRLTLGVQRTSPPKKDKTLTRAILMALNPEQRHRRLERYLQEQIALGLGVPVAALDVQQSLDTLQFDSLLAIELEDRLEADLEVTVPLVRLLQGPSIARLAGEILDQIAAGASITTITDLQAEVVLDPAIKPDKTQAVGSTTNPAAVFLTGGTGFLGAFLLHELLQHTQAQIYCLVRATNPEAGQEKIQANLTRYALWSEALSARIIPVAGDLAQPQLGLSAQQFAELSHRLDVIYHGGAFTNFIASYPDLKAPNVGGTQEILRLATQTRVKPLHYISSIAVFNSITYAGVEVVLEEDPLEHTAGLFPGYAQSKWVAEKLVTLAGARGLPVSIYRPGIITGHSQTGVCNTGDFISKMLKGFVEFESAPELDLSLDLVPVDYVSQAIVYLSRQEALLGKIFHLVNPQPVALSHIVDWARAHGYHLQQIPYSQWLEKPKHYQESVLHAFLPFLTKRVTEEQLAIQEIYTKRPAFDQRHTSEGLAGSGIVCPVVDTRLLDTYFTYFIDSGFIDPP